MAPAIFTNEEKDVIRNKMLEEGFSSIKNNGFRNTSVAEIAKSAGIAKGTFYNFFHSKEHFVVAVIEHRNNVLFDQITNYCKNKTFTTSSDVHNLLKYILSDVTDNLYNYLSLEEIISISNKVPDFIAPEHAVKKMVDNLLSILPDKNNNCNWKLLVNYSRLISLLRNSSKEIGFYVDVVDQNIDSIISLMVEEIMPK